MEYKSLQYLWGSDLADWLRINTGYLLEAAEEFSESEEEESEEEEEDPEVEEADEEQEEEAEGRGWGLRSTTLINPFCKSPVNKTSNIQ